MIVYIRATSFYRASLLDLQQLNDFTDIVADAKFRNVLPGVFCSEMDRRVRIGNFTILLISQTYIYVREYARTATQNQSFNLS